jgi:hypothetical protein
LPSSLVDTVPQTQQEGPAPTPSTHPVLRTQDL